MTTILEGQLSSSEGEFAIVVSRFNDLVTKKLLEGAIDAFRQHGVSENRVTVAWVPGAYEIPVVAKRLAQTNCYAAVVCLGAVIQGETTHHEYINMPMSASLMNIGQETGIPVLFGILTCQTLEQALNRAGGKVGNKGCDAALAAIETVNVLRLIDKNGDNFH
ncbi:6,7-dimethyl-8-ribityllumazine synthase [hydrothermal vent metagenome]|uniref:6,7-dimethyl-8-ribityllumazine synthase n=1 Tax=hydrothermal vent metagenome TaxID=652676 RepID=A0A3B1DY30_9ZZZZ